jgi:hypothetical protein
MTSAITPNKQEDSLEFWTGLLIKHVGHNRAQTLLKRVRHDHNQALNTSFGNKPACSAAAAARGMVKAVKQLAQDAVFRQE